MSQSKEPKFYIHSKCCKSHWELLLDENGNMDMCCEICNLAIGPHVHLLYDPDFPVESLKPKNKGSASALHTRCCHKHWEIIVYEDDTAKLVCAECGTPEDDIIVSLDHGEQKCDCCGEDCEHED